MDSLPLPITDIILIVILIWGAIAGFKKGLILTLASFIAIIAGAFAAYYGADVIASELSLKVDWSEKQIAVVSFAIVFFAVVLTVHILARVLEGTLKLVTLGIANKIAGAVFGIAKNALILTFIIFGMKGFGQGLLPENATDECVIYPVVESIAPLVLPYWEDFYETTDLERLEEQLKENIDKAKDKIEDVNILK
ncbi:MAG: CvpA family protein [Bacteroidetes bacterium]|jgi:membrane protein required for colicin V production|nr:CvpA family protein [Bacteroidota bacterium]MDA0979889.1 CvpA family protein [Bacteroidota bacterium]